MATSIGSHKKVRWKSVLDFLAVAGPIICLIDCVVLPVASALLPILGMTEFGHGINDQQLFLLVLAICGPIIVPGYLKHRNKRVLGMFFVAISMMFVVNFVDLLADETAHAVMSILAAGLLIKANRDNKKLLSCACSMHTSHASHASRSEQPVASLTSARTISHEAHDHRGCSGHSHDHVHAHAHAHPHVHVHTNTHAHAPVQVQIACAQSFVPDHETDGRPCIHDLVVALEMQDHGLDPNHFEPRNNLNFDTPIAIEAPPLVSQPVVAASCCG